MAILVVPVAPLAAHASGAGEMISHYAATYTLSADGSVRIDLDFDYVFGADGGHGPYLRIPVQVPTTDPTKDRLYPLESITASSPTGAPADITTTMRHGEMFVYIGDKHRTVRGTQTYRVSYTQKGVVNHVGDHDEFYWNVLAGWDIWILDATAIVRAPAAASDVTCYQGEAGSTSPCPKASLTLAQDQADGVALPAFDEIKAADGEAAFWSSITPRGSYFTIAVTYPKGTFASAPPIGAGGEHRTGDVAAPVDSPSYTADPKERTRYVFEWDALTVSIAVGGGALLLAFVALLGRIVVGRFGGARSRARDRLTEVPVGSPAMAAMSAGLPMTGVEGAQALASGAGEGTRSTPPDSVSPGEVSFLATGGAGSNDFAIRLADLAERRVIGLEPVAARGAATGDTIEAQIARAIAQATGGADWLITTKTPPARFTPSRAESALLTGLFAGRDAVTLKSLGTRELNRIVSAMRRGAIADVAAKKWFRPGFRASQRLGWMALSLLALWIAAMVGVGFVANTIGPGPWFIAMGGIFAAVIVLMIALRRPVPRTKAGAAAFAELEQFKRYLVDGCTSRRPVMASDAGWAPFAVAFGLAAPFAMVTQQLGATRASTSESYPWWAFVSHGVGDVRTSVTPPSSSSGSSDGASGSSGASGSGSAGGGGGGTGGGGW